MHNKNHDGECELLFFVIIEMGKMGSGRALQKSLFIRNACGYKAKLVLGFFFHFDLQSLHNRCLQYSIFPTNECPGHLC